MNSYGEVLEVLSKIPEKQLALIPQNVINNLKLKSNGKKVKLKFDMMGNVILSDKAKQIIVSIYKNYFLDNDSKEILEKKLRENYVYKEEKIKQSYNNLNDPFYQNKNIIKNKTKTIEPVANDLIISKNDFWTKIKSIVTKIKKFLKTKK